MKRLILFFTLGLLAGTAFAQEEGGDAPPPQQAPAPRSPSAAKAAARQKVPQTCEEKCTLIVDPCRNPCAKVKNPAAKQSCKSRCSDLEKACQSSCREKGRIDPKYIQKKLLPQGTPD